MKTKEKSADVLLLACCSQAKSGPKTLYRLNQFPVAAALRTVPEATYLEQHLEDVNVARMLERRTTAADKTLALMPVAKA